MGSSPTSSRNTVPPSADSNSPTRRLSAPVKAPFSCPNSSLSMRADGSAAQSTRVKEFPARALASWMASASSPLPHPVSPSISTVASVRATFSARAKIRRIASLWPRRSPKQSERLSASQYSRSMASKASVVLPRVMRAGGVT